MNTYYILGESKNNGDAILFTGTKRECIKWIWDNCDIGDLFHRGHNVWTGVAYYDTDNTVYSFNVDRFYI